MPSKTKKQAKFMAAVANNPKFAKKAGVPQSVGKDFAKADKGKTFKEGGMPSYFDSTKGKPGKAVKKYNKGGRTAADTAGRRSARTTSNSTTTATGGKRYARGGRTAADNRGGTRIGKVYTSNSKTIGTGSAREHPSKQGYNQGGVLAHDKKELRNLSDEDYRIRNRSGSNTAAERRRIDGERSYLRNQESSYNKGGKIRGAGIATQGVRACKMR